MKNQNRSIVKTLTVPRGGGLSVFTRLSKHHTVACSAVFIYYISSVYISYGLLANVHSDARGATAIYQWPVKWLNVFAIPGGEQLIAIGCFLAALACILDLNNRLYRIVFALFSWMVVALLNSYGAINHGHHIWIWLALFFAFAPRDLNVTASRRDKLGLLAAVSGAQLFVLMTYSLAGLHKINGGLQAILRGEEGNFSFTGFANQIADRVLQTETEPFAADLIIAYPALFAPAFWFLIIAQAGAVALIFFPRLHRSFGLLMIAFHSGTWAFMEITFPLHVLWLLLLFVFSPFRPGNNHDSPLVIARDIGRWFVRIVSQTTSSDPSKPTSANVS